MNNITLIKSISTPQFEIALIETQFNYQVMSQVGFETVRINTYTDLNMALSVFQATYEDIEIATHSTIFQ